MIDFACKKFELNEIIKCSLNLTKLEFHILEHLIKNDEKWFSTHDISNKLNIGLSTVQKALRKLYDKNVVQQYQKNISGGGYFFMYRITNKPKLRKTILGIVQNWTKKVEFEISLW